MLAYFNDDNNDDAAGKFTRISPAGCLCIMWPCESIVKTVSLRIQYMAVDCETKTKDNVFVRVAIGGKLVKRCESSNQSINQHMSINTNIFCYR